MPGLLRILCAVAVCVGAVAGAANQPKQLYRVTAPQSVFDATLPRFRGALDVWHTTPRGDDNATFEAQIYATDDQIALFQNASEATVERDAVDTGALLESRALDRAKCASASRRRRLANGTATLTTPYVDDPFFDCFREASEIFAFLDALVDANPKFFSKIRNVTTTYEGRTVPGYKISTGSSGRKALYTQSLIHAREWVAGSSTLYAIASLLDHLRANDPSTNAIFGAFEWHFVPVLNIDGYMYSWSKDRLWRKNRRKLASSGEYGVDLNRNYPPESFFGKGDEDADSESYPGASVLSEPETAGAWAYLKKIDAQGVLDMHSYGGLVMRAYGNQRGTPPAPYGPKLKVLGDVVAEAAGREYESQTSAQLYEAYGCFDDAVFQVLNKPVLTIEMAGDSFIADESTIRPAGKNMFKAFVAFAQQIPFYWRGLTNEQSGSAGGRRGGGRTRDALSFEELTESRIQRSD